MTGADVAPNVFNVLVGVGLIIWTTIDITLAFRRGYYWNKWHDRKFTRGSDPVMFWVGVCGDVVMCGLGITFIVWGLSALLS